MMTRNHNSIISDTPDSVSEVFDTSMPVKARIKYDGTVHYNPPAIIKGAYTFTCSQSGTPYSTKMNCSDRVLVISIMHTTFVRIRIRSCMQREHPLVPVRRAGMSATIRWASHNIHILYVEYIHTNNISERFSLVQQLCVVLWIQVEDI